MRGVMSGGCRCDGCVKEIPKVSFLFRGDSRAYETAVVEEGGSPRRSRGEAGWSGMARRSVDIYVGVVREDEEDVVGINANANVVRDAEAYEEWQGDVAEKGYRRNGFKRRVIWNMSK